MEYYALFIVDKIKIRHENLDIINFLWIFP